MSAGGSRAHAGAPLDDRRVATLEGAGVLARLGTPLDDLLESTGAPVTARRPWLEAWIRCHPGYQPVALVVGDARRRLEAAALLARRRRFGIDEHVALGHGPSDHARLPARTPEAAAELAAALVRHLASGRRAWRLVVRHLPCADPVAERVACAIGNAELVAGDAAPALRFGPDRSLRACVSRNHHQQVRRMANRLARDGLEPSIEHLRQEPAIRAALPELEEVCRRRDFALRGHSRLEQSGSLRFFREVILCHAARGEVELTSVRLRGRLAAYTLCFLDRGVRRMWSCRLAPEFARYGVGRLANDAALRLALADPGCAAFDWMRGEEPYKSGMSNDVEELHDLLAWSSPALKTVLHARRRLRDRLRELAARHAAVRRAWSAARQFQAAGRRRWRVLFGPVGPSAEDPG